MSLHWPLSLEETLILLGLAFLSIVAAINYDWLKGLVGRIIAGAIVYVIILAFLFIIHKWPSFTVAFIGLIVEEILFIIVYILQTR